MYEAKSFELKEDQKVSVSDFPRVSLAHTPTPLEPMPNLTRLLGGPDLLVKRDDCTGLAMGGNKARQLEFYFGDVLGGEQVDDESLEPEEHLFVVEVALFIECSASDGAHQAEADLFDLHGAAFCFDEGASDFKDDRFVDLA